MQKSCEVFGISEMLSLASRLDGGPVLYYVAFLRLEYKHHIHQRFWKDVQCIGYTRFPRNRKQTYDPNASQVQPQHTVWLLMLTEDIASVRPVTAGVSITQGFLYSAVNSEVHHSRRLNP